MRLLNSLGFRLGLIMVLVTGCVQEELSETIDVSVRPQAAPAPSTHQDSLQALERAINEKPTIAAVVKDIHFILKARALEEQGQPKDAVSVWRSAAQHAEGRFGKIAVTGWLKSYTASLGKKSDASLLAKLILSESGSGAAIPYFVANDLRTEAAIIGLLEQVVPEALEARATKTVPPVGPLATSGVQSSDPVFNKARKTWCQATARDDNAWRAWVASLEKFQAMYWQAVVLGCTPDNGVSGPIAVEKQVSELRKARDQAKASGKAGAPFALEAMNQIIKVRRAAGERETVVPDYIALMADWELPGISPDALGLEAQQFAERRIDETLWAARYQALVGDLEGAKKYAQQALTLVANSYATIRNLTPQGRESLAVFRAEAYHVLAFRIAVERKEFDSAIALNAMAQQTQYLNQEWKDRLAWFAGIYEYLAGNLEGARRKWEAMLVESPDENLRAPLYFWLARTYYQLGRNAEGEFYIRTLVEDYPLSFYAVVAVDSAGLDSKHKWNHRFTDLISLEQRLRDNVDYGLQNIRSNQRHSRLLLRAEILCVTNLSEMARIAVAELDDVVQKNYVMRAHSGVFVYLSRLHFAAGNYFQAIALTTQLAGQSSQFWETWPEQFLIYFPQPYSDLYARVALDTGTEKPSLMAISRQESSFRADIKSPANALGVMQLMVRTAARYQEELKVDAGTLDERLLSPQFNIAIGGRYLRDLNRAFQAARPAVYGAYNAGEYAVESWIGKRNHQDPLLFIELIPYGETKGYVRNVWRNEMVYKYLSQNGGPGFAAR